MFTTTRKINTESRFKAKHSLDSDEEDEPDPVQESGLGDEDLAAQEDTTIVKHSFVATKLCNTYLHVHKCVISLSAF